MAAVAGQQLLQNGTSALLDRALGGDAELDDALQTSLVNTFVAAGFNAIGDFSQGNPNLENGSLGKAGLHAVMGGLAAEAAGGDFRTGALAAGVNELLVDTLADQYSSMAPDEKNALLVMNSQLIGALAAAGTNGVNDTEGLQIGAQVAGSATLYNYLNHQQINEYVDEIDGCAQRGDCVEIQEKYHALSNAQQEELLALCQSDLSACRARYEADLGEPEALQASLKRLQGSGREEIPFSSMDGALVLHLQNREVDAAYLGSIATNQVVDATGLSREEAGWLGAMAAAAAGGTGKAARGGSAPSTQATNRTVTDFVDGVTVVDRRTGTTFTGTVDLRPTLHRIETGGSFPHGRDGSIFENRPVPGRAQPELPVQPQGYYTEYVHPTPGVSGPGPQRIVTGASGEIYYTPDHYSTFIRLDQ